MNAQPLTARLEPGRWMLPAGLALLGAALGVVAGVNPALAVAGALGVGLLLLAISSLIAGIVGFIALSFLELVPSLTGPALSLAKLAGLVLAISWAAGVATGQYRRLFPTEHPWLTFLLITFLAWNLMSFVWAEELPRVLTSTTSFLLNFALFPIVYSATRTAKDARWIVLAFIGGATFAALYAIAFQPSAAGLATSPAAASGLNRLAGTVGDPNELAAVLAAGVALSTAIIFNPRVAAPLRFATMLAAALMLLGVFLTLSRGGLIALAAVIVAAVLFSGTRRPAALGGAAIMVVLAFVFFFQVASPEARQRITNSDGGSGRTDIWNVGWRMVEAEPVRGIGAGNFQNTSIHYLLAPGALRFDEYLVDVPSVAHNAYLGVLAETGVIGLLLFLAIIAACIAAAVRAQQLFRQIQDRDGELVATGVIMAICALLAAYFFLSEEHSKHLWLLLSLGPAMLAVAKRATGRDDAN